MQASLVTDNPQDEAILAHALRLAGIRVVTGPELQRALGDWERKPGDLLVTALRTPNPLRVIKDARHVVSAPIILIIDGCSEDAHLELLDAGADWVLERPYSVRLFVAYARVLMRRADIVARESLPPLSFESVRLDPSTRSVRVGLGPPQRLSQLEFRLLHSLMLHEGQVLPTETIVEHVWGYTGEGDRSLVRGLINRLRAKIEPNPNNPRYIRTIARVGYAFGMADE